MHSATKRRETREKMKDGGKKNAHKSPHWLPTIFIQSFRVPAWLPVTVAMVVAHFINEEICQGGEKDPEYVCAVSANRNGNKRPI